jgi:iron complex outermembrane receptor protein
MNDRLAYEGEVAIDHQELDAKYASSGTASNRVRDTTSFTPRVRWRHDLGSLSSETVFGLDYYEGKVSSDNTGYADQGASQQSSAVYLQNITKFTQNLNLTLGARSQRVKQKVHQDADALSPALAGDASRTREAYDVGLTYAAEGWRVYGKTGTTFRFANLDELFGYDPVTFASTFAGNLKPQHGRINEVGGSIDFGPTKLRASFYKMDLTDEIGYDGTLNTNFDPTRRKGAELEADWKVSESLQAKASYAYTDASFRSGAYAGNAVPLVPRDQAGVQLTWNAGRNASYSAAVKHVGERRYGSDFTNAQGMLGGYTTLDLQAVWNLKPWKITAKLLNALDKKYAALAGYSSFYSDTYYFPADRRSLFLSGRFDF